jgi:hypothetical protein
MKFARYTFLIAGIYGLLVMLPQYFAEDMISRDHPPAITHVEFFYGFVGLAVVFQLVFLIIAKDPVKYRLMIIPSILEKLSFGIPAIILHFQGRIAPPLFLGGMIDLVLCALFIVSYFMLRRSERT